MPASGLFTCSLEAFFGLVSPKWRGLLVISLVHVEQCHKPLTKLRLPMCVLYQADVAEKDVESSTHTSSKKDSDCTDITIDGGDSKVCITTLGVRPYLY